MTFLRLLLARLRGDPPEERTVATRKHSLGVRIARQRRGLFGWYEIDP